MLIKETSGLAVQWTMQATKKLWWSMRNTPEPDMYIKQVIPLSG